MKKLKQFFHKCGLVSLLIAAIALSIIFEIGFFNFDFFSQKFSDCPRIPIDLSVYEGYNGEGLPLLPDSATISFDNLYVPVRSVTVHTAGPVQLLAGNIGICDEASAYRTVGAGSFQVVPGGTENTFTVKINSRGDLSRLRINFTDELSEAIFLTSVVLNEQLPLQVNVLRLVLIAGVIFVLLAVFRFRLYEQDFCLDKKSHQLLNLTVLGLCLLISAGILYGGSADHTYLKPYPTLEEVRSPEMVVDAYMQQLDAFEKGQLELDLDVNPELDELDNVYDKGERDKKGVTYHWDRAYYNGKYYSYFGLAPLFTVYYPVYWMTEMLPTELLATTLLAVFAILAIFTAIQGLLQLFKLRANLLLFLAGEMAVVCGSFLYLMQASLSFYYLPLISAIGWLATFVALASFALCSVNEAKNITSSGAAASGKQILLFALCGVSVVMLVLSRPNSVLLAVAFASPLFLQVLFDRQLSVKRKLQSAIPFLIPVAIGGAAIMYYNYIRFDSFFEFGTTYQLTESDIRYNHLTLSAHHFGSMLYHYFCEPFVHTEFFPFLRFTTEKCIDFGNYLYQEYSAGVFTMPLNLGLFLAGFTFCSKEKKASLKKWVYGLLIFGILALGYLDFLLGGIHIRYVCDLSLIAALLSFLLMAEHVHYNDTKSAKILYVVALGFCLITISRGMLTIFSNETNDILRNNPDFYLKIAKLF